MSDRAVSELVGFILIFGIIMTGGTLIMMVGQDQISDINEAEQINNADNAMTLIGQSLNGLDQTRSASTVGTINLDEGSLASTSDSDVTVTVENDTNPRTWSQTDDDVPTGGLTYSYEDTVIRYENGMVLRSDRGNGIARTGPRMRCSSEQAIASIVSFRTAGDRQLGSGRASVVGYHNRTELLHPVNRTGSGSSLNATNITVQVTTDHEDVWDRQMDAKGWVGTNGDYACDVGEAGRVTVRRTVIDLSFDR